MALKHRPVSVLSAAQAAHTDAATIGAGVPSRALMQRAGAAAAAEIARRYPDRLHGGVLVHAGAGNNGGDGWVVARALAAAGVRCQVIATGDCRTDDARAERELAEPLLELPTVGKGSAVSLVGAGVVVDGLLGTGAKGEPRGTVADGIREIAAAREGGAVVVALDMPSGVDATSGASSGAVRADLTLTFGSMKRGLLVARASAGEIAVLEIGLLPRTDDDEPLLVDGRWVRATVPTIAPDAHKGIRRKLVVIGGATGMAGATVLAARAAMATGIGMVRLLVSGASLPVVQGAVPEALAGEWPGADAQVDEEIVEWGDVVAMGPGLGHTPAARALVERVLRRWRGPVLLDADALNVFAGRVPELADLLAGRPALLTPHPGEFGRLTGMTVDQVLEERFDAGRELARTVGAAVLLKGVPTVISDVDGRRLVSAAGTPALAAAGSGDLLSGIAATLLGQLGEPLHAGACAAWAHGRAAELACEGGTARGITLADVLDALPSAWRGTSVTPLLPVLAQLPAVH